MEKYCCNAVTSVARAAEFMLSPPAIRLLLDRVVEATGLSSACDAPAPVHRPAGV